MPRIDPLKLLTCLSVLLAPNGGIKSIQEVKRIASLMGKFSKKLVSKCIYIQILKCSETDLLGQFMETDGWMLTHSWLKDAIDTKNWPLVREILELFLLCPVDVNRLKSNSAPKLVKTLSKDGPHEGVQILATKLVEQWLKVVKGEAVVFPNNTSMNSQSHPLEVMVPTGNRSSTENHQLIDPSNLAISDELNGIGSAADAHIDVDEIIPTINHDENTELMDVDGDFLQEMSDFGSVPAATNDSIFLIDSNTDHLSHSKNIIIKNNNLSNNNNNEHSISNEKEDTLKFKFTMKDGKTLLAKINSKDVDDASSKSSESKRSGESDSSKSGERGSKDRRSSSSSDHKRSSSSSHHKSSSSKSSSSKSSSRDKERSSSHKSSSHSKSSSSSSSKDRSKSSHRDREKRQEKEKERERESQSDKDKDTLAKVMGGPPLVKLGKIPKKKVDEESDKDGASNKDSPSTVSTKKSSISIEVRKGSDVRPKTVKTFNSQFRDHGLVAEIPPPPSRKTLKKPSTTTNSVTSPVTKPISNSLSSSASQPVKRAQSPIEKESPTTEKKIKLDFLAGLDEKPGSIKLIAPRSKPTLIESDMFMDALCSSATTNKKDPKKRKRRISNSKDGSPPLESPKIVAAPMKFYQDTLEEKPDSPSKSDEETSPSAADDLEEAASNTQNESAEPENTKSDSMDVDPLNAEEDMENEKVASDNADNVADNAEDDAGNYEPRPPGPGCGPGGPPGVLILHRRSNAPKKSVRWRPQESLEEVKYFELDETERVNVTKTFMDMKQMERYGERDAFQMARKLQADDVMVEQMPWITPLFEVDDVPSQPEGNQSKEREVQRKREETVLQALYFNFATIPDSAAEPDPEMHKYTDPAIIPLEDGNQNTINDFTKQGWPEPKESLAPLSGPGMGGVAFNGMGLPFGNESAPYQYPLPFMANQNSPAGAIWNFGSGGPNTGIPGSNNLNQMPPFAGGNPNLNADEIKMAMNRLTFPGPNFMAPNFNGINMMNLPGMSCGPNNNGPRGAGNWFRPGAPPGPGNMQWRNAPPVFGNNGGPRRDWSNNNNNSNNSNPRLCKLFKRGVCKKGDKCNFLHPKGGGGSYNRI